jgi:hypothetical protein
VSGGIFYLEHFFLYYFFHFRKCCIFANEQSDISMLELQDCIDKLAGFKSAFANHHGLNFKQAYSYLKRFKGIAFLDECYEAEHQLSISDAVSDLSIICNRNGGALI